MPYIPESHKKYNVLPNCVKYNFELIVPDDILLKKIEKLVHKTDYMGLHPYQRFKSYQECFDELEALTNEFPNYKDEILKYKDSIIKMNNKDMWAIVKYIGESNWNFTKDKYYYVVIYLEKDSLIVEGIIDNEEYSAFSMWLPGNTNQINLSTDFEIVLDPSGCLNNEFKKIMATS